MTEAEQDDFDPEQWRAELEGHREQKDDFLADHPQSPLPPEEREGFAGLDYFDPDPDYRVRAEVEVHGVDEPSSSARETESPGDPEPVEMDVSAGRPQRYLRVATLHFELDGDAYELAGYRQEDQEGLFVPFRDKTTGQQTYQDGRYMEFETEGDLEDGAEMVLDFNLAYSPFCAFSEVFSCPLPPEENWLETEILAGEKAP